MSSSSAFSSFSVNRYTISSTHSAFSAKSDFEQTNLDVFFGVMDAVYLPVKSLSPVLDIIATIPISFSGLLMAAVPASVGALLGFIFADSKTAGSIARLVVQVVQSVSEVMLAAFICAIELAAISAGAIAGCVACVGVTVLYPVIALSKAAQRIGRPQ